MPIGDDAAVLEPNLVLTVDTVVEGTHFRREFAPLEVLARRAVMAAASDIAAMGADPTALLTSWILPDLEDADFEALVRGTKDASEELGVPVVGGNMALGALSLTTTVVGRADVPIARSGASAGESLYVTGSTGEAALGLEMLLRAQSDAEAWLRPRAHIQEGRALRGVASACVDVSDGLLSDLAHLCESSGLGAIVDLAALPRSADFEERARSIGCDPVELLLTGGEAYVLLFASGKDAAVGTRVGEFVDDGLWVRDADGVRAVEPRGFDHFSG